MYYNSLTRIDSLAHSLVPVMSNEIRLRGTARLSNASPSPSPSYALYPHSPLSSHSSSVHTASTPVDSTHSKYAHSPKDTTPVNGSSNGSGNHSHKLKQSPNPFQQT